MLRMPERIHSPRGKSICLLSLFLHSCEAHIESPTGDISSAERISIATGEYRRTAPRKVRANLSLSRLAAPRKVRANLSSSFFTRAKHISSPHRGHIERGAHIDRHRRISTRLTPKRCALTSFFTRAKHISSPHRGHIERGAHIDRRRRISMRRTPKSAALTLMRVK